MPQPAQGAEAANTPGPLYLSGEHLADIKTPDGPDRLFVLLLLLLLFPFFLWSTLCLFLFLPLALIFTTFVTHVCYSVFRIEQHPSR